jgi:lipopolysaccharide/colanic/teichoic acid biosynthesis glycosyltransferase
MPDNAEANGPQYTIKNDTRISRFGKFLRRTRLDEIPQFYNVLKGEMSLIGPRPERPVFVEEL